MRASRFSGRTLLEAVRGARETLGPDALIVAARRVRAGGWLRPARADRFEVTALEPTGASPPLPLAAAEIDALRGLVAGASAFAATLEQTSRLAEELSALRRAVETLRPERASGSARPNRHGTRVAAARLAPEGTLRRTDSTPRSVDSWNRD